jgi:hypothetical protein
MDHHRHFRMQSLRSALGPPKYGRFPLSRTSAGHAECEHLRSNKAAPTGGAETPCSSVIVGRHPLAEEREDRPDVRAQVKQLQFWLKVFARFCQDRPEKE